MAYEEAYFDPRGSHEEEERSNVDGLSSRLEKEKKKQNKKEKKRKEKEMAAAYYRTVARV